jgi:hypothetical protein
MVGHGSWKELLVPLDSVDRWVGGTIVHRSKLLSAVHPGSADRKLAVSAVSLPLASRYLERVWGWKELIRFCFIVIIGSNVIAFGFSWLSYIILGTEDSL